MPKGQALTSRSRCSARPPARPAPDDRGPSGRPGAGPGRAPGAFVLDAATGPPDERASPSGRLSSPGSFAAGRRPLRRDRRADLANPRRTTRTAGATPAHRLDPDPARRTITDPGDLFRWLSRRPARPFSLEHGAAVASMILAATPSARQLRWIDQAITQRLIGLDAFRIRASPAPGGRAGGALPRSGTAPLPEQSPGGPQLDARGQRDADSELSSATAAGPQPPGRPTAATDPPAPHRAGELSSSLRQRLHDSSPTGSTTTAASTRDSGRWPGRARQRL